MKKFVSTADEISLFSAKFCDPEYREGNLYIVAKGLTLRRFTAHNPSHRALTILQASLTFYGIGLVSYEKYRYEDRDPNVPPWIRSEKVVLSTEGAVEEVVEFLQNNRHCYMQLDGNILKLNLGGGELCEAEIHFKSLKAEWDTLEEKFFEDAIKCIKYSLPLHTPDGIQRVPLYIQQDIAAYYEDEERPTLPRDWMSLKYKGKLYIADGDCGEGLEALAKLQLQLPEDVRIQCCITCKHGNQHPCGNNMGDVFCTRGFTVADKGDIINILMGDEPEEKYLRHYTDLCDEYGPQSDEYYTYSSYYVYLKDRSVKD